jgi:hypothetical protein
LVSVTHIRREIMTRILTVLAAAATLAATSLALPSSADARIRGGGIAAGVIGGLAAGAIIGSAVGGGYYAPGYGYAPAHGYAPGYYGYAPSYGYAPGYYGYRNRGYPYTRDFQGGSNL